jgi:DNA modification methylase
MKTETVKNIELSREDCMDLLSRSPDKSFDLALVDPPTVSGKNGKNATRAGSTGIPPTKTTKSPIKRTLTNSSGSRGNVLFSVTITLPNS